MKRILALFSFLFVCCLCIAQVTLQPLLPQVGVFQKGQLWNVLAVNSSTNTMECYLMLSSQDRSNGMETFSATSASFTLGKGAKQLNVADLTPIQYSYLSSGNQGNDFLTVGSYMACFKLMEGTEVPTELAETCVPFDVGPLSPPMLMAPADSSVLQSQPAMFTWQPPAPLAMFQQLHYQLIMAEILPGQKPEEAIELNAPVYTDLDVQSNVMNYTGAYPSFEKGKWYAWEVVAKDGSDYAAKTDVWDFSITTNPITPKQSPGISYVKLKRGYDAGPSLCKGILNLEYANEVNDAQAGYTIVGLDKGDNHVIESGTLKLKPGQNLIDLPLDKKFEDNKRYMLHLINSRSEDWNVKFIINRF